MTDYPPPDEVEGPEDVDPAFVSKRYKVDMLIRAPEFYTKDDDGNFTVLHVPPTWLDWSPTPLIMDPTNCGHGFTICTVCCENGWL
jgi:hypothetical protein